MNLYAMILPLLPAKARPYAKTYLNLIVTVLALLSAIWVHPVLAGAIQLLGVLGVYAQPNGVAPGEPVYVHADETPVYNEDAIALHRQDDDYTPNAL